MIRAFQVAESTEKKKKKSCLGTKQACQLHYAEYCQGKQKILKCSCLVSYKRKRTPLTYKGSIKGNFYMHILIEVEVWVKDEDVATFVVRKPYQILVHGILLLTAAQKAF